MNNGALAFLIGVALLLVVLFGLALYAYYWPAAF
jgi:hypothetical protein